MKNDDVFDIEYYQFFVFERPFCIWDYDIKKRNMDYLKNIDPSFFVYMADKHFADVGEDIEAIKRESQYAALALRTIYSQALETFFAFLCYSLQAPLCPSAWISLYSNQELHTAVDHINGYKPIKNQTIYRLLNWEKIADLIFENLSLEDKQKEANIKNGFADLWQRFASDFLNPSFIQEYNSIKHGLRVQIGGFSLSMGVEKKPGVPAESDNMVFMGKSDFGTKFNIVEKIENNKHNIRIKNFRRNWNPDDYAYGIHLLSMSLSNVISFLEIINGKKPENVVFEYPNDLNIFNEPWKRSKKIGVKSMGGYDPIINKNMIDFYSSDTILENYIKGMNFGKKSISLSDLNSHQ